MDDHELPAALWHDWDQIERCTECLFEVVGGVCQDPWCGKEHAYDDVRLTSYPGSLLWFANVTNFYLIIRVTMMKQIFDKAFSRGTLTFMRIDFPRLEVLRLYWRSILHNTTSLKTGMVHARCTNLSWLVVQLA